MQVDEPADYWMGGSASREPGVPITSGLEKVPVSSMVARLLLRPCKPLGVSVFSLESHDELGLCVFARAANRFQVLRVDWNGTVHWESGSVEEMQVCAFRGATANGMEGVGVTRQGIVLLLKTQYQPQSTAWHPATLSLGSHSNSWNTFGQATFLLDKMTPRKTFGLTLGNGKLLRVPKLGSTLNICFRPFLKEFSLVSSLDYTRCYFTEGNKYVGVFHVLRRKVMLKISAIKDGDSEIRLGNIRSIKAIDSVGDLGAGAGGIVCILGSFYVVSDATQSFKTFDGLLVLSASLRRILFKIPLDVNFCDLLAADLPNKTCAVVAVGLEMQQGSSPWIWNPNLSCFRFSKHETDGLIVERVNLSIQEHEQKYQEAVDPDAPQVKKACLIKDDSENDGQHFKLLYADSRGHVGVHQLVFESASQEST